MGGADHLGKPMSALIEPRQLARVARCFDAKGRLQRWPSKRSDQLLVLWVVWWQLPGDRQMSEMDVSGLLKGWHDYEDYALLRRELVDLDLLRRTPDGRVYIKINQNMPEDAKQLAEMFG